MLESRSALESYRAQPSAGPGAGRPGVRVGEIPDCRILHVGVFPGAAERVSAAVQTVLGTALPESPTRALVTGDGMVLRIAPDQYWLVGGDPGLEGRLSGAISADDGAVTCLDGARTRLFIEGPSARALLGRLVPIDLDPDAFPPSSFAQTGIHHVGGLLLRSSAERYEFFALRTFAASTWEVLVDAASSFGHETVLPQRKT